MSQNLYGNTWTPAIGQTIELYIFRDDAAAKIDNLVLASFTLEKKEVTGAIELQLDGQNANQGTFKQTTDGYTMRIQEKFIPSAKIQQMKILFPFLVSPEQMEQEYSD